MLRRKQSDIVKQYQSVTFPLQYIYLKKSIGPGGARNRGLEAAKGDYVLFIDSDDWIDVDCLQKSHSYFGTVSGRYWDVQPRAQL